MSDKLKATLAWILFGFITISVVVQLPFTLANGPGDPGAPALAASALTWMAIPIAFGLVGALIISRRPRNVIGLLLMLPAIAQAIPADLYFGQFTVAPADPNLPLIWIGNWSWLLLIMPVFFILVLFPTGKPLTPRWRLPIYLGLGMSVLLILLATFGAELGPVDGEWTVPNPIGFLPVTTFEDYFATPWIILLLLLTIMSAAALIVRFRRTRGVEREQIKWLFYAGGIFALVYALGSVDPSWTSAPWWNVLFALSLALIPLAIGAAILRYRLYDIDIIIRRTLVYGLLTGVLLAIYFGVVLVAQSVFVALTGQESPIAIVISTLLIAALFNPLRRWLQDAIDRRFYRRSYDAGLALAQFAQSARDEVEMDKLEADLLQVITETMQPQMLSVWLAGEGPAALETPAK